MNFIEEIESFVNTEFNFSLNDYRYIVLSGKFFYIEGKIEIDIISSELISFKLKSKTCKVKGFDLSLKYLDKSTAQVEGKIIGVEVI